MSATLGEEYFPTKFIGVDLGEGRVVVANLASKNLLKHIATPEDEFTKRELLLIADELQTKTRLPIVIR